MASLTLQKLVPSYKDNLGKAVALHGIVIEQRFAWLVRNLKKRTVVIDIGAYIGDTAIYFASFDNVKAVYAYEPYKSLYAKAARNIKLSRLDKKIRLLNAGVTDSDIPLRVSPKGDIGSEFVESPGGSNIIRSYSLNTILKGKKNVIIKSNCEGSEYKIFNKDADLRNVYRINIAYHYGLQKLPSTLKSKGFKVKVWREGQDAQKGAVGTIYAWRK
jgi:FkbM family methyltransferase